MRGRARAVLVRERFPALEEILITNQLIYHSATSACLTTIASAEKQCQFIRRIASDSFRAISIQGESVCGIKNSLFSQEIRNLATTRRSVGEGIHRPADSHANQQKKKQSPQDVFKALDGLAPSQESEGNRNHQGKEHQSLQMAELQCDRRQVGHHALRPRAAS